MWDGRRQDGAHRIAYRVTYGDPPEDKPFICHRCDNPPCCNPAHLFASTQAGNLEDMDSKGRRVAYDRRGEVNPFSKLTAAQAKEIRRRYDAGELRRQIAEDFGLAISTVKRIGRRRTWKHVA